MIVWFDGSSRTFTAPTWSPGDTLDLFIGVGGSLTTVFAWRVNNGPVTVSTDSSIGSPTYTGEAHLLSSSTSYQLSSWVQQVRAWYATEQPDWVP